MTLDRSSPLPLYHQIVESIRYRIATGDLKAGDRLDSLKDAAEGWDVNLHTVRRAYGELSKAGLVKTSTPHGTRVLPAAGPQGPGAALRAFIDEVRLKAHRDYGLSPTELALLIDRWRPPVCRQPHTVSVIECSLSQCADLCRQIESQWSVEAVPWDLGRTGEPSPGPLLGTYFHYNAIRQRWPHRLDDLHFVALRLDPELRFALRGAENEPRTVILCEWEAPMASNIAADLRATLPKVAKLDIQLTRTPSEIVANAPEGTLVLFSPRVWGQLQDAARADARAREARYVIDDADLETVASRLGWQDRQPGQRERGHER